MKQRPHQANGVADVPPRMVESGASIPFAERLTCTIAEACAATGLGRTKLYELIGDGRVDTATIGRRRLVKIGSLQRLLDVSGESATDQPVKRRDAVFSRASCFEAAQNAAHASINRRRFSNKSPRR